MSTRGTTVLSAASTQAGLLCAGLSSAGCWSDGTAQTCQRSPGQGLPVVPLSSLCTMPGLSAPSPAPGSRTATAWASSSSVPSSRSPAGAAEAVHHLRKASHTIAGSSPQLGTCKALHKPGHLCRAEALLPSKTVSVLEPTGCSTLNTVCVSIFVLDLWHTQHHCVPVMHLRKHTKPSQGLCADAATCTRLKWCSPPSLPAPPRAAPLEAGCSSAEGH